jgi:ribonuclease BN (tRNA processing enzyme)
MQLIPLGTNGFIPTFGRHTMSFLVLTERQALLLDAGSGVSRLLQPEIKAMIEPYDDLSIVFSHYHLDHTIGMSYLPAAWPKGRIRVFGPARPLVSSDPQSALEKLFGPPLFPMTVDKLPVPVEINPVTDTELELDDLQLTFWRQAHPGGSVGIRIGNEITYMTDTAADPSNLEFASDVKLLIHELWLNDAEAEGQKLAGHASLSPVAEFARAAAPQSLLLVHHHPKRETAEVVAMAAQVEAQCGIPTLPGAEGKRFEL